MPSIPRRLVGCTHRLFRRFERSMDKFVGMTGPLFVFFAIILLIPCTIAFFEVVFPYNFPQSHPTSQYIALFYCLWHATMIFYHYYCSIMVSPGFSASYVGGNVRVCQKCNQVKPERTHHCKVCKRCVLKYDHHCPWINQCVGLNNERYFVLFMFYLSTAAFIVVWLGFTPVFKLALPVRRSTSPHIKNAWTYRTPAFIVVLLWVLAIFIGMAVAIMLLWQLYLVIRAESSVENQDNSVFRKSYKEDYKKWSERGHMDKQLKPQEIINPYDFGVYNNLCLFFNVGKGRWSWLTLLVPMRIPATSDGYTYPKLAKQGLHLSFDSDSELDGEMDQP